MNRSLRLLAALLIVLAGTGCSHYRSATMSYLGVPSATPTDPAQIEILQSPPSRPHDRLGEIVVNASLDPAPARAKIEARFRREGARLGADAVFIVQDQAQPTGWWMTGPYWSPSVSTVHTRVIVGVALKYRATP